MAWHSMAYGIWEKSNRYPLLHDIHTLSLPPSLSSHLFLGLIILIAKPIFERLVYIYFP